MIEALLLTNLVAVVWLNVRVFTLSGQIARLRLFVAEAIGKTDEEVLRKFVDPKTGDLNLPAGLEAAIMEFEDELPKLPEA